MQEEDVRYLAGRERGLAGTCPPQGTHGRRAGPGTHAELSPTPTRAAQCAASAFPWGKSHAHPRSSPSPARLPPSPHQPFLPQLKLLFLPLHDRSAQMPGGAQSAGLCCCRFIAWMKPLQHRASVSLLAKRQERCSITLGKHSESLARKNVIVIAHLTIPSLARENSDAFYPLV